MAEVWAEGSRQNRRSWVQADHRDEGLKDEVQVWGLGRWRSGGCCDS